MNYKKLSIIAILFLVLPSVCGALVVDLETHQNRIVPSETANFTIKVTNPEDQTQELEYFFPSLPGWSVTPNPIITNRDVAPNETIETYVRIKPVNDRLTPKQYQLPFTISSKDGVKKREVFNIYLRDFSSYRDYVPILNVDVDAKQELVPTKKASMTFTVTNRNRLNITNFVFEIDSTVNPNNDREINLHIPPNEKVTKTIEFSYAPQQEPGTDTVKIKPYIPAYNKTYDIITKEIEIKGYTDVESSEKSRGGFLKSSRSYTFTNEGNVVAEKTKRVRSGTFKEFFTSTSPDYEEVTIDGYKYLEWDLQIEPSGTEKISLTVNYRPLFIVLVLVVVGVGVYYYERSPVVIKKEAKKIPGFEGETSRLKILLHVKNRTNKPIENLNVVDSIPRIAQLGKKHGLGTMQPSKVINNEKRGTIVKWNIPVLEAYEERIISYQIYSKLEIIGPMKLAKARLKYKNKRGKTSRIFSNNVHSA